MAGLRYSKQREAILSYLLSTREHPTAETVYKHVRKEYPKISLGTVYRNLNLLADSGEALKLDCGDGFEHFDGNPKPHYHFICKTCGRVLDLDIADLQHINTLAATSFNGRIDGHTLLFFGECPHCCTKSIDIRNGS